MSWPVIILVLLGLIVLSGFVAARAPGARIELFVLAMVPVTYLVFAPWRCDGALRVLWKTPPKPTACQTVYGANLPHLWRFAPDSVGYGLAVAAFGLSLWLVVGVMSRRFPQARDGSHPPRA